MWKCPECKRLFKNTNQSHMCTTKDGGELQAWLIIKPMKKELDVKFYAENPVDSDRIRRTFA